MIYHVTWKDRKNYGRNKLRKTTWKLKRLEKGKRLKHRSKESVRHIWCRELKLEKRRLMIKNNEEMSAKHEINTKNKIWWQQRSST